MATQNRELFSDDDTLWDDEEFPSTGRSIVEWVAVVAGAVLVALLIKTFVVQAFFIPSESMMPTLVGGQNVVGDRVLVNKLSYRLHDVRRGDVIVFERPSDEVTEGSSDIKDLIKRVIALPGETVYFDKGGDGKVYINGELLNEPYLPAGTPTEPRPLGQPYKWTARCTVDDPCRIPPGTVWVMGDNRKNSSDSRYIGPINKELIVGRAFVIVWPIKRFGGL